MKLIKQLFVFISVIVIFLTLPLWIIPYGLTVLIVKLWDRCGEVI